MKVGDEIAIGAAVVSLLGAASAWWQARQAAAFDAYQGIGTLLVPLNQVFVDHPELGPYFLEGGTLPNGSDQKAKAVASMILNILEAVCSQEQAMGREERKAWKSYTAHEVTSVAMINDIYTDRPEWYPNIERVLTGAST